MRPDIIPGACFPDYELTDHTSTRRKLSELQGSDPLILVLAREHFCPKEHQQHLELAAFYPKIAVAYTQIVTITTDTILELNEFRDSVGAPWTFLICRLHSTIKRWVARRRAGVSLVPSHSCGRSLPANATKPRGRLSASN